MCTHWWEISSPNGKFSSGVCKWCGLVRKFENSTEIPSVHIKQPQLDNWSPGKSTEHTIEGMRRH